MRVTPEIDVLAPEDLPAIIACRLLDAAVFPHPSVSFGTEVWRAGSRVWVLRDGSEVRGFAAMRVRLREGYIMGFAIDPERHGRGLGGALLGLYEARGFRRSKHEPRFYGADEDAYVMSRRSR